MRYLVDDDTYAFEDEAPPLAALTVVCTRYSMATPFQTAALADDDNFRRYIADRTPIFRDVCFASMKVQDERPDLWLIGFDDRRREAVQDVVDMVADHPWIIPVWQRVDEGERPRESFSRIIKEHLRDDHDAVLTMRVDNDDALSRGFVQSVSRYAAAIKRRDPAAEDFWISFPFGSQYDGDDLRIIMQNNSPFVARHEPAELFRTDQAITVFDGNHTQLFSRGTVHLATTWHPMWLQNVHGSNVVNSVKTTRPVFRDTAKVLWLFGMRKYHLAKHRTAPAPPAPPPSLARRVVRRVRRVVKR